MKTRVKGFSRIQGQVFATVLAFNLCTAFSPLLFAAEKLPPADKIKTDTGDLTIQPVNHATLVLEWNGKTIYVDPVGGAKRFGGLPKPDLILVTDIHGDHMDAS